MSDSENIKIPIVIMNTTSGLTSALQLLDNTSSFMLATIRNDTSNQEILRIIYPPANLSNNEF